MEFWPPCGVGRFSDAPLVRVPCPLTPGGMWGAAEVVHLFVVVVNRWRRTPEMIPSIVKSRSLETGGSRGSGELWAGVKMAGLVKFRPLAKLRGSPLINEIRRSVECWRSLAVKIRGFFIESGGTVFKIVSWGSVVVKEPPRGGDPVIIVFIWGVKILPLSIKLIFVELSLTWWWPPPGRIRVWRERGSKIGGTWVKIRGSGSEIGGAWSEILLTRRLET